MHEFSTLAIKYIHIYIYTLCNTTTGTAKLSNCRTKSHKNCPPVNRWLSWLLGEPALNFVILFVSQNFQKMPIAIYSKHSLRFTVVISFVIAIKRTVNCENVLTKDRHWLQEKSTTKYQCKNIWYFWKVFHFQ